MILKSEIRNNKSRWMDLSLDYDTGVSCYTVHVEREMESDMGEYYNFSEALEAYKLFDEEFA